jgi:hypothetical protein
VPLRVERGVPPVAVHLVGRLRLDLRAGGARPLVVRIDVVHIDVDPDGRLPRAAGALVTGSRLAE